MSTTLIKTCKNSGGICGDTKRLRLAPPGGMGGRATRTIELRDEQLSQSSVETRIEEKMWQDIVVASPGKALCISFLFSLN